MFIKYIVIQWIIMVVIVVDGKSQFGTTKTNDYIICVPECRNGYCVSPGKCACNPGYEATPTGDHSCVPVCDKPCTNGFCIAPNECRCNFGYRNTDGVCEPSAICRPGWAWEAGKCTAQCKYSCGNGTCVSPNQCICFPGYRVDIDKLLTFNIGASLCSPVCTICTGICVAPNKCITEAVLTTRDGDSCLDCGTEAGSTSSIIYDEYGTTFGNGTTSYGDDPSVVISRGPISGVGVTGLGNTTHETHSSWIKQHHVVCILASLMGIVITVVVLTLLINRCKPALVYFIGRSYVISKDPRDDHGDNGIDSLEDIGIELSDHKKT